MLIVFHMIDNIQNYVFFFGCPYKQKSILIKNWNECVMLFVNFRIETPE